jgi:hypothetical protein
VVAGAYHDHVFVPVAFENKALMVLKRLISNNLQPSSSGELVRA